MAKGEDRYKKPDANKMQNKDEKPAEKKAEAEAGTTKDKPEMTKTPGIDPGPDKGSLLGEVYKRHLDERRRMNTRHEGEHREMGDRHMKELGGMMSASDITDASGVGGAGGNAGA